MVFSNQSGAVRGALFNKLQTGIALRMQVKFDGALEPGRCSGSQLPVHLQSEEVVLCPSRPGKAAQIVFARGKDDAGRCDDLARAECGLPAIIGLIERFGCDAPEKGDARGFGRMQQKSVETAAGEGPGLEGKLCFGQMTW